MYKKASRFLDSVEAFVRVAEDIILNEELTAELLYKDIPEFGKAEVKYKEIKRTFGGKKDKVKKVENDKIFRFDLCIQEML